LDLDQWLYQPVSTATTSNFTLAAIGFVGTLNFPGSFSITPGRTDGLVVTLDEGSVSALASPSAPASPLSLPSGRAVPRALALLRLRLLTPR
jgi:hypothetical protein